MNIVEKYLVIITTVLELTQIVRVIQNAIQLHRQNVLFKKQVKELADRLTRDYYNNVEIDTKVEEISREELLCNKDIKKRYKLLLNKVKDNFIK